MSCTSRATRIAQTSRSAGLTALQNKAVYLTAASLATIQRQAGQAATTALRLVESFEPPQSLDTVAGAGVAVAALLGGRGGQSARLTALRLAGVAKLTPGATAAIGTGLARLSQTSGTEREQRLFFPKTTNVPVRLWSSRLTSLLNSLDLPPGVQIARSTGQMFEVGGRTWHQGTVAVQTGRGARTLTHLQSLNAPARHYYFNRALSNNEAVGIVTGQKGFEPKTLAGYVTGLSEAETLCPGWARAKHTLAKMHVYYSRPGAQIIDLRQPGRKR